VTTGFSNPVGILFDGSNIWVTDEGDATLKKLDQNGAILQTVSVSGAQFPAFDGTNIWVPGGVSSTVSVVRAATGVVIATLSTGGSTSATQAAFDGQRILVTNEPALFLVGGSVELWRAADLTRIGGFSFEFGGVTARGVCSDGINFWMTLDSGQLARF
jgi:DNA-binding beta-propeller fold protein YncE